MAVVSLVESPDLNNRKPQVNSGLQVNFDLPLSPRNFTQPINFPGIDGSRKSRDVEAVTHHRPQLNYGKYGNGSAIHNDLSAGAFYTAIKELMSLHGYHETCLERAICEMAKDPLHVHEEDVLSELLHLFLTPTSHQSFDLNELDKQEHYEEVEKFGREEGNCEEKYSDCDESLLQLISDLIEVE